MTSGYRRAKTDQSTIAVKAVVKREYAMAIQRIADMTLDDLNKVIEEAIDRRLQGLLKPEDSRTTSELLEALDQLRFTPPEGAKSTLEMLREDRDA